MIAEFLFTSCLLCRSAELWQELESRVNVHLSPPVQVPQDWEAVEPFAAFIGEGLTSAGPLAAPGVCLQILNQSVDKVERTRTISLRFVLPNAEGSTLSFRHKVKGWSLQHDPVPRYASFCV